MDIFLRIKKLKKLLYKWGYQYYTMDDPVVSDEQYDGAITELKKLEKENPELITLDSPTQKVGGLILDKFPKVAHKFPMLSLSNVFNKHDLINFDTRIKKELNIFGDIEYICELKIDGLSISLRYKNGFLDKAITRGNGAIGEDVTNNVRTIKSIPSFIKCKKDIEIRGEVFMTNKVFETLNKHGLNFSNPRNAASGTLRQLDSFIVSQRQLSAFFYMVPNALEHNLITHLETLEFLKKQKFQINEETKKCKNINSVIDFVKQHINKKDNFGYKVDGIVVKVNNNNLHEEIGYTFKAPKYMVAYKFPEEIVETQLLDIFPTIGRTGKVTYNAKLSPVILSGTMVSAATLYNASYVKKLKLDKGDFVKVKKAGEIIPRVIATISPKKSQNWTENKECPHCGKFLYKNKGEIDQYCINKNCCAILQASIKHFVSKGAMDIEGLGEKTVEKLIIKNIIRSIFDIYKLKKSDLFKLEGFQEKYINKLLYSIQKSKTQNLEKFIFGLGIKHVGSKCSKILSKRFGTLEAIVQSTVKQLGQIREIGPKVISSVVNYFSRNKEFLEKVKIAGLKPKESYNVTSNILLGKTFVITGKLSKSRNYFCNIIEGNSGNLSNSISSKTDFLLTGEDAGTKLSKAKLLKVDIINEVGFEKLLKGALND